MKGLPFDIWVATHASQFDLHKKHAPEDSYRPDAFFDHAEYDTAISQLRDAYLKRVNP